MLCLTAANHNVSKKISCKFILKSLIPLAKTEKSSNNKMLLQTNKLTNEHKIHSRNFATLMFLPVRAETHICSETRALKWWVVLQ